MTKDTNIENLIGWLSKSYQFILLVVLAGIVIHAPLTVFLGGVVWPEFSEIIKAWKEVLLLFASGLAVILVTNAKMWPSLLKDWLIRLSILYALLHVLILFIYTWVF